MQFHLPPVHSNTKPSLLPLPPLRHFSCDVVPYTCQASSEVNKRTGLTGTGTGQTSVGIGGPCTGTEPNDIVAGTGLSGIGTEMSGFGTGMLSPTQHMCRPRAIPVGQRRDREGYYDETSDKCSFKVKSLKSPRKIDQIVQTDLQEDSSNEPASKDNTTSLLCLGGGVLDGGQGTSMNRKQFAPPLLGADNEQGTSMEISTVPPVMVSAKGQGTTVDIGTIPLPNEPETAINVPPLSRSGEVTTRCVPPPTSGPAEGPRTLPPSNKEPVTNAVEQSLVSETAINVPPLSRSSEVTTRCVPPPPSRPAEGPSNAVDQSLVSESRPVLVSPIYTIEHTTSPQAIMTDCAEEKYGGGGEVQVRENDGGVDESSCWTVTPCGSPDSKHPHSIGPLLNEVRLTKIIILLALINPHFIFEC